MRKVKVHIVGTHGVPANYGGFETLADFFCQNLGEYYDITVYCNAHKYTERNKDYFGAKLKYLKLDASGFKGIFYDLITYCRAMVCSDVILYLSPVGSGFMTPLKKLTGKKVIVNHGGLNEWEREKLSNLQKRWAKFNHRVASVFSDVNVVDNHLYQKSLKESFGTNSIVIRYGGDHAKRLPVETSSLGQKYPFVKQKYAVSVSRAQVDNNIHLVLETFKRFTDYPIVLVSNWNVSDYGIRLKEKYSNVPNIILLDAIYDKTELDYVRGNASVYVHSHSRCGTAPSLVEAMSLGQPIISFDVPTNRETTQEKALFFSDVDELVDVLGRVTGDQLEANGKLMKQIATNNYKWHIICEEYKKCIDSI